VRDLPSKQSNNNAEIVLYKYLSKDYGYFENELLRFSQRNALNDPFEFRPGGSHEKFEEQRQQKLKEHDTGKNRKTKRSKPHRIKTEKIKNHTLEAALQTSTTISNENVGIFCLSKRWNSVLMWSHYANSHQGFCLGLNRDKLAALYTCIPNDSGATESGPYDVIYSDERIPSSMDPENNDYFKLFYTKSKDWSYEQECRIVTKLNKEGVIVEYPKDKNKPPIYKRTIPHACIDEIIIGINTAQYLIDKIIRMSKEFGITVYKSKQSEESFNLERDKYEPSEISQTARLRVSEVQPGSKGFG
jgi:Protein of unknown function (DUF2971)